MILSVGVKFESLKQKEIPPWKDPYSENGGGNKWVKSLSFFFYLYNFSLEYARVKNINEAKIVFLCNHLVQKMVLGSALPTNFVLDSIIPPPGLSCCTANLES